MYSYRIAVIAAIALLTPTAAFSGETETIDEGAEIAGQVADIHDYTHSSGYQFQVALRGLTYVGQADRTLLERKEDGSLTIWLAFRDIRLTIGRISLTGQPGNATCGPMALHIGHLRELWVAFDFDQQTGAERSLKLAGSRCRIENDNWSIGNPAWVQTSGLFMTQGKVVSGVRSGLAGKRQRIEQELQQIAYTVLAESCTESGEAPTDRDGFEAAVEARLAQDGHLSGASTAADNNSLPLTGFIRERPALIRQD